MSNGASKELTGTPIPAPQSDGLGTLEDLLKEACRVGSNSAASIVLQFGSVLGRKELNKVLTAFRRRLFPPRRRGRKRMKRVTEAHKDWKAGVRGVALYRAHIPGWEKHNWYRQKAEEKALRDAIRSRERREASRRRKFGVTGYVPSPAE